MSVRKWMFAGALLLAAGLSSLGFAQKPCLRLCVCSTVFGSYAF